MAKVCVYCETIYPEEQGVCLICNELDGLLPIVTPEPRETLDLDPTDYPNLKVIHRE